MIHRLLFLAPIFLLLLTAGRAHYIEFALKLDEAGPEPFMRDIRARIIAPDKSETLHPAFHDGDSTWKVRVRPTQAGLWRMAEVREFDENGHAVKTLDATPQSLRSELRGNTLSQVGIDPQDSRCFAHEDGRPYYPVGLNAGWTTDGLTWERIFSEMQDAGLNWIRIWMAHWDMLNLDWLPEHAGPSPKSGALDAQVARNWDNIIALAEKYGVFLQMVFQHHGQYSLTNNSNWDIHPWNKANGGFLDAPQDFFTSPEAIRRTKAKYRYIIARYGHSAAILAWEFFNEVHWTVPAMEGRDDILGAWHAEMAAFLRANDPYRHLVTTSHDDLRSSVYASMDFLQPHLYAVNMLVNARRFAFVPETPARPLFWGETGDDHMPITPAQKSSGAALVPIVWSSLFAGNAILPGQTWYWERILGTRRIDEMRALSSFIAAARLPERHRSMQAFSPRVTCQTGTPRVFSAGYSWAVSPVTSAVIPDDGRDSVALADIPRYYIANPLHMALGMKRDFDITFSKTNDDPIRITLTDLGWEGGALRFSVDGRSAYEVAWSPRPATSKHISQEITLPVPAGEHTLRLENTSDPASERHGSFTLGTLNLTGTMPALAATGLRNSESVLLYVWHRENVFSETQKTASATAGEILIDDLSAGKWTVTWWDMGNGGPASHKVIEHHGGTLKLRTPEIHRHAAAILEMK